MINTIIDGHFFSYVNFSVFCGYGKIRDPLKDERSKSDFMNDLANKFFYMIKGLPKGGKVVFCIDSQSWRKNFFEGYKKSRNVTDDKSMMTKETKTVFYDLIDEFSVLLKRIGIIISKVPGAEGDDLIAYWNDKFRKSGDSCIIVSGDRDLAQCVGMDDKGWTIVWTNNSNSNKIYVPIDWQKRWLDNSSESVFEFNVIKDQDTVTKLIRDTSVTLVPIVQEMHIMKKILIGDDGDDVPSVWSIVKEEKVFRITDKKADKIIQAMQDQFSLAPNEILKEWGQESYMDFLAGSILRMIGDIDGSDERAKVKKALERNAKLVWLTGSHLPPEVLRSMENKTTEALMEEPGDFKNWNKKSLLEGTTYESGGSSPRRFDPFSMIDLPQE